jgi:hypothetical protein
MTLVFFNFSGMSIRATLFTGLGSNRRYFYFSFIFFHSSAQPETTRVTLCKQSQKISVVKINFTTFCLSLSPCYILLLPFSTTVCSCFKWSFQYCRALLLSVSSCFAPFSITLFYSCQHPPMLFLELPWLLLSVSPSFTPSSIFLCSFRIAVVAPFSITLFYSFQYLPMLS